MRESNNRILWALFGLLLFACAAQPAAAQECVSGMFKVYDERCRQAELDSGQCTTRHEQTPPSYWCCCNDGYQVSEGGNDDDDDDDDDGKKDTCGRCGAVGGDGSFPIDPTYLLLGIALIVSLWLRRRVRRRAARLPAPV